MISLVVTGSLSLSGDHCLSVPTHSIMCDRADLTDNSVQLISDGLSIDDGGYDQVSTSAILRHCKLKVLVPYSRLLSLLGWRQLISQNTLFENPLWIKLINFLYVTLILALIISGYFLHYSFCYRQDGYRPYNDLTSNSTCCSVSSYPIIAAINNIIHSEVTMTPETTVDSDDPDDIESFTTSEGHPLSSSPTIQLTCRGNFFAIYFVPNLLHFFAYMSMFHLMRTPESEKLETLMERGFLQTTHTAGWILAHKKLANSLRSFLWMCLAWFTLSVVIHGLIIASRIGSHDLTLIWHVNVFNLPYANILLIVITFISLTFNDLICASIVTSYTVHAQLNISYLVNLCSSIREKRIQFQVSYCS